MKLPEEYIKDVLDFDSIKDLIENLYLKIMIKAFPKVKNVPNIHRYSENKIRNEFQKVICFESGKISDWINNRTIFLCIENEILTKSVERKRIDIAFNIPKFKFIIECKKVRKTSKSQYIKNGILRFINDEYTNENDEYAAMCSFVVADNIEKIIKGTKELISNYHLIDLKEKTICNYKYSFSSSHNKCNTTPILIYHLFFDFYKN